MSSVYHVAENILFRNCWVNGRLHHPDRVDGMQPDFGTGMPRPPCCDRDIRLLPRVRRVYNPANDTSLKYILGRRLAEIKYGSFPISTRLLHKVTKLPLMFISLTG
jgi:hypothetical protein